MVQAITDRSVAASASHGDEPPYLGRRLLQVVESQASLTNGTTDTGTWVATSLYRNASVTGRSNGTNNVTIFLDLDYDGDSTVDETITVAAAPIPVITRRGIDAVQARVRLTNNHTGPLATKAILILAD